MQTDVESDACFHSSQSKARKEASTKGLDHGPCDALSVMSEGWHS